MYSSASFVSLIVMLSLGYVVPKAGVGDKNIVFSIKFDVISPWGNRCKFLRNSSNCEIELSGVVEDVKVENLDDGMYYVMGIKIGAKEQEFKVRYSNDNTTWLYYL